jgi:hypothetical protein
MTIDPILFRMQHFPVGIVHVSMTILAFLSLFLAVDASKRALSEGNEHVYTDVEISDRKLTSENEATRATSSIRCFPNIIEIPVDERKSKTRDAAV